MAATPPPRGHKRRFSTVDLTRQEDEQPSEQEDGDLNDEVEEWVPPSVEVFSPGPTKERAPAFQIQTFPYRERIFLIDGAEKLDNPLFITLCHPRAEKAIFIVSGAKLFELQRCRLLLASWFRDDSVIEDGSLWMATLVDPLFAFITPLDKGRNKKEQTEGYFRSLQQVMSETPYPDSYAHLLSLECDLSLICDAAVLPSTGEKMYRLNDAKLLSWLTAKARRIAQYLETNDLRVAQSAAAAATLVQSSPPTKEEFLKAAVGLLSEYVPEQWIEKLATCLGVPAPSAPSASTTGATFFTDPLAEYKSPSREKKESDKKEKPKLSPAQKKLQAVDKRGMQPLTAFFAKKPA